MLGKCENTDMPHHATMHRNTIDFGYNSGHVALCCLEVVPVVYARVSCAELVCSSTKMT